MANIKTLKLTNGDLDILVKMTSVELSFERSRSRNKFLKLLQPFLEDREKSRLEILKKLCNKDEKGEPVMVSNGFDIKGKEKEWGEEYIKLMDEEIIIDVLPSNEKEIQAVRDVIINNSQPITVAESMELEKVVEAIENINK